MMALRNWLLYELLDRALTFEPRPEGAGIRRPGQRATRSQSFAKLGISWCKTVGRKTVLQRFTGREAKAESAGSLVVIGVLKLVRPVGQNDLVSRPIRKTLHPCRAVQARQHIYIRAGRMFAETESFSPETRPSFVEGEHSRCCRCFDTDRPAATCHWLILCRLCLKSIEPAGNNEKEKLTSFRFGCDSFQNSGYRFSDLAANPIGLVRIGGVADHIIGQFFLPV
jgi:hypothetical protein